MPSTPVQPSENLPIVSTTICAPAPTTQAPPISAPRSVNTNSSDGANPIVVVSIIDTSNATGNTTLSIKDVSALDYMPCSVQSKLLSALDALYKRIRNKKQEKDFDSVDYDDEDDQEFDDFDDDCADSAEEQEGDDIAESEDDCSGGQDLINAFNTLSKSICNNTVALPILNKC